MSIDPKPQPNHAAYIRMLRSMTEEQRLAGGSERQMTDALRVYEVQHVHLDFAYLEHWADYLGVGDLLAQLRERAAPPQL